MITFELEGKEYQIPKIITISQYVQIFKVKDFFDDEQFAAKLISTITGAPIKQLLNAGYQEVEFIASQILSLIPNEKPEFIDRFELNGVHYGFFPNWKELTFAEFMDLDTISTKKVDELLDLLHILAAIMYRPIVEEKSKHDFKIEKYDVNSMKQRAELFKKDLDVRYVLGAQSFFTKFVSKYLSYTQLSSIQKLSIWMKIKLLWNLRKMIWGQIFKKRSGGSLSSTEFLTTILQSMNMSTKNL